MNRDILFIGIDGGDRSFNSLTITSNAFFANGTAANPSIAFDLDRNTGIFRANSDVVGIAAGGLDSAWFSATAWQGMNTLTSGIQLYNTAYDATNYERLECLFAANVGILRTVAGGTGTVRALQLGAGPSGTGNDLQILSTGTSSQIFDATCRLGNNNGTTLGLYRMRMTSTHTAGSVTGLTVNPTYNQASGNAANTDLKIARNETTLGSGTQAFIQCFAGATGVTEKFTLLNTGKVSTYAGVATAGNGVAIPVANPRQTAVTNTTATLATYTVPAADSSFYISANVQVTAATTAAMTVVCTYTDETNTSRAQTIPFVQLAGTFLTSITNVTGTGPYEGATLQIRCKASTTIVFTTAGTVTGITYNVEGIVTQAA